VFIKFFPLTSVHIYVCREFKEKVQLAKKTRTVAFLTYQPLVQTHFVLCSSHIWKNIMKSFMFGVLMTPSHFIYLELIQGQGQAPSWAWKGGKVGMDKVRGLNQMGNQLRALLARKLLHCSRL
jgi:hypothetical protein